MSNEITRTNGSAASAVESVLIQGDLAKLTPDQRLAYYKAVCESLGLNPLTQPFQYIVLGGKLVLYARRDATEQLRKIHAVSITKLEREVIDGVCLVTAHAATSDGRTDSSIGAVNINGLQGDALANAYMKAETKSKRRVTLSICGLGMLDESEVVTIQDSVPAQQPSDPPGAGKEFPRYYDQLLKWVAHAAGNLTAAGLPTTDKALLDRVLVAVDAAGVKTPPKDWKEPELRISKAALKKACEEIRAAKPKVTTEQLEALDGLMEEARTTWPEVAAALKLNGATPDKLTPEQYERVVDELRRDISGETKHEEYEDEPVDADVDIPF